MSARKRSNGRHLLPSFGPGKNPFGPSQPKAELTTCDDCGARYTLGAPHLMWCAARTCDSCGTTYGNVIAKDSDGNRVCDRCLNPEEES